MKKEIIYESFSDVPDYLYYEHEVADKNWISRAHYHKSIEFSVCLKGTHRICVNGTMYAINESDICCINRSDIHYFDIRKETETIAILLDELYLNDLKRISGLEGENIYFPALMQDKEKNAKAIEYLLQWEQCRQSCGELQNHGYADLFLGELYQKYGLTERIGSKANREMRDAIQYIQDNLNKDISLETTAHKIGYSKNHFAKLFHNMVGQTFRDYINTQRVEYVKRIIENEPQRTIMDIVFSCGFDSMATFYRAYLKRFGKPPREDS